MFTVGWYVDVFYHVLYQNKKVLCNSYCIYQDHHITFSFFLLMCWNKIHWFSNAKQIFHSWINLLSHDVLSFLYYGEFILFGIFPSIFCKIHLQFSFFLCCSNRFWYYYSYTGFIMWVGKCSFFSYSLEELWLIIRIKNENHKEISLFS